jgi:hypothetical protein
VTKARSNATAEAAKGDLRAGTGTNLSGILAVGNNGETLVADSSTSTGLRYQSTYNGNAIINGGTDFWQRGTSFTLSNSAYQYLADRFYSAISLNCTNTFSQSTDAPTGFNYSMKWQRAAGVTTTPDFLLYCALENFDSTRFAGQAVTLSFYAKVGANYSGANQNIYLYSGTGTNQGGNIAAWTGATSINSGSNTFTPTTSWQRFTLKGTVPSTAKQLGINFATTTSGTAGADDSVYVTGFQLELGSVQTSFKRAGGTIQGELAACQRYYNRYTNAVTNGQITGTVGYAVNTTLMDYYVVLPVQMRVQPTVLDYSNIQVYTIASLTNYTTGSWATAVSTYDPKIAQIRYTHGSGVFTAGQIASLNSQTTSGYVGLSAEL